MLRENANILSFKIPEFLLMMQDSKFVNDKDLTGE
jgi:hypothetical protein